MFDFFRVRVHVLTIEIVLSEVTPAVYQSQLGQMILNFNTPAIGLDIGDFVTTGVAISNLTTIDGGKS